MPRKTLQELSQTISRNVQGLLDEYGLTQRQAAGSSISQKSLSNIVRMGETDNNNGPSLRLIQGAADQLGVPAYQLLINNLPENSARRKQLDQLVRAFVAASADQQDWIISTLEMMGQIPRK